LEAINYMVLTISEAHLGAAAGLAITAWYQKEVRQAPKTHGHGSPTPLVALGTLRGLALAGIAATADQALTARWVGLCLLVAKLGKLPPSQLELVVRHFFVLQAYEEGKAKIIFNVQGTLALLKGENLAGVEGACHAMLVTREFDQLLPYTDLAFTIEDGVPMAPEGTRALPIGPVIRSIFCATGGTMATGRAPPGPVVRKIKRRRGKKGRGRKAEDDGAGSDFSIP